jgi:uncharacterized protein (DUF1800 family)
LIKAKVAAFFALYERQERLAVAISTAEKALSRGLFLFWSEHVLMFGLLLT